ncbi:MAG: Ig-like domain-containing protein [Verrucomicrobiota bacterium]
MSIHCTPDKPILVSPLDGATGIDPSTLLQAEVNDPQGDNLEVTFWGTMPDSADPFTVVVLPDTQKYFYTDDGTASLFEQQMQWIIQNRDAMNIVFVSHEGDIVDTVTDTSMWIESDRLFNLLDAADIPYGLLPGNHDMVVNYPNHDLTAYNTYFPAARYSDKPWYGGCFDGSNANNYQIIQASGQDLLFMHLEFWPSTDASRDVIAWANSVINAYPNHKVIITTHGYLDTTAARTVHVIGSTEYIWEELVRPNPNVYFVLCGHVHGEARRSDTVIDSDGSVRQVHQLLADYQTLDLGGLGWLRIMTFVPREDQVYVETYSPYLNAYQTDADSQFILDLPMGLGAGPIGTSQSEVPGIDSSVSVTWSGLEPASEYFWWVEATDPTLRTRMSDVWSFTTTAGPPPAAPSDLTAIAASSTAIQLAWTDNAINETGFRVEQSIDGSLFTPIATLSADSISTAVDGLTPESTYFFRVCAFHSDADSAFSNTATETTPAANRPPTALNQTVSCQEDAGIQITLAASDPDQAPLALTYTITAPPMNGYASQPNGAVVTYTPNNDFNGADSFSFVAFDGEDYSEPATITLDVAPMNDAPVAQDDSAETLMGTGITISPLANDTDIDGDLLLIEAVTQSVNGVVTLNPDQTSITYIPNSSFVGTDTIAYSVTDGALSSTAYIVVTVSKPTLFYDGFESGDLLTGGWTPESIASATTSAAFLGAYGAELKKTASLTKSLDCGGVTQVQFNYQRKVSGLANGEYFKVEYSLDSTTWIQVEATSGTSDWNLGSVLIEGISGLLQLRFSLNGNAGNDLAAIDEVEVVAFTSNTAPVTAADAYSTAEDTILAVAAPGLLGNDSDPDGDPLTASLSQAPINGTLDLNPDGSFTYTPMPDFFGADAFSYTATDGTAVSSETSVSIEVTAVNDPPNALDDSYSLDEGATLTLPAPGILANDTDPDGDALSTTLQSAPTNGSLSLNPDGSFTYTPADGFSGTDAFTYAVNDGALDSATATVTLVVNHVNHAPVTAADAYSTAEDTILAVAAPGLLGNDSDPDGDPITASLSQAPINGTLDLNPDGSFTYTPIPDFFGADTFSYTATDGTAVSSETSVSIEVTAVNDPPNALDDAYSLDEGATLTLPAPGILANDTDPDGDTLSTTLQTTPTNGSLSLNPDGSFTYTPADGFNGTDAFTYAVNDGALDSATATVILVVNPVATGGTLHVASIQVVALDLGKGLKQGYAEVVIVDSSGNPIEGAIVTGTFTEDITETQQSTTGTDGMAVFQTTTPASGRCHLTFTVDSVNLDGWLYDPTANVETSDINY